VKYFLFLGVILLLLLPAKLLIAGPKEEVQFAGIEAYCLTHINNTDAIGNLISQVGGRKLPKNLAKGYLEGREGNAWYRQDKTTKAAFILMTINDGSCKFFAIGANPKELIKLLEANLNQLRIASENIGSQTRNIYTIRHPHPRGEADILALATIDFSRLSSVDGAVLSLLPKSIVTKRGVTLKWPMKK
jgi:hypothetical protein